MRNLYEVERLKDREALFLCVISIIFIALSIWRVINNEWISASIFGVGAGLMLR